MKRCSWILLAALIVLPLSAASLEITIEPVFKGKSLRLDSLRYRNSADESFSVTRLSYLLSGFALEDHEGKWTEFPEVLAWMDAASRRNRILLENAPAKPFRSLRFHVGLDRETDAADVTKFSADHPLNPNLNGLHWSWQGGYIFMAIEGHYRNAGGELKGFSHHLARDANRALISIESPFDLRHDAGVLIHFDLAALLNGQCPLSFEKNGSTTHSRDGDSIAAALVSNLPESFRLQRIASTVPVPNSKPTAIIPIDLPQKYTPYRFVMNRMFPMPDLPRDNPLIEERVALGQKLFHEKTLSRDGTISCASCHQSDAAFTDRLSLSRGIDGHTSDRNAMPLMNLAWKRDFFWDGRATSLRDQVRVPIEDHREMGESLERVCEKLGTMPEYAPLFVSAFRSPGITAEKVSLSLEQFLLTLTAHDSRFDRMLDGKAHLTDEERRGFELFMTEYEPRTGQYGADCFHCHGGALFSDHQFHNNGLKSDDLGRSKVTKFPSDDYKFSTPSLRNIALTAPYMHDGRFATLEEVVEHYNSGIHRSATLDPNLAKHPKNGLNLSDADKSALVAFLKTLTEESELQP